MAFNNETSVSSNKRNLKRMNRLHDNGKFSSFDNAGFEEDGDNSQRKDAGFALFSIEETYPQNELGRRQDENQINRRRLPAEPNSTAPKQNVEENIELQVKNDNSTPQESRTVLGSINTDTHINNQTTEDKDNDVTDARNSKGEKVSKMAFNVNLKRFQNISTSNNANSTEPQDRLKLTRQAMTEDLSRNRRGSADVFGTVLAAARFSRTSSLRSSVRKGPPRLLRDLSFSDADDSDIQDYGSLKNINLPRRIGKGPLKVETVAILESLIHELIKRGKIYQAVVLDLEESDVLASVPSGMLSKTDALGMTKSIICQASLFRLQIGDVDYSCFKHRQDAVQGRTDELVMVMQMTKTCVVAGFSRDDSPGSCNSEVHEFAKVLEQAGW